MKKKLVILTQALLLVFAMLAAQACLIAPEPYHYGRPYGPAYGYAHPWHHGDWDHDGR